MVLIYGSADGTSSLNIEPAGITSSSTLKVCLFPFGCTRLRPSVCSFARQRGTHSIRVKVTHLDRRRLVVLHRNDALTILVIQRVNTGSDSTNALRGLPTATT